METRIFLNACLVSILVVLALLADSRPAFALAFSPTELEWNAWSALCRARYTVSGAGAGSKFANRVSKAEVATQEAEIGNEAWYYLHHYCAALVYLSRAQNAESEIDAKKWLREAKVNLIAHYQRISKTNRMFSEVVIALARVYREMGDTTAALNYLEESIRHQPEASSPYALAALFYRKDGSLDSALEVLLKGNAATDGTSAELHFLLGHIYIDLGDLDSAVAHAELAYELGYPLPGLASKLRRLGRNFGS